MNHRTAKMYQSFYLEVEGLKYVTKYMYDVVKSVILTVSRRIKDRGNGDLQNSEGENVQRLD